MSDSIWKTHGLDPLTERSFFRYAVNASWLIKLRWVAATGQLLTILIVSTLIRIPLPLLPLAMVLFATIGSNPFLHFWFRSISQAATSISGDQLSKQVKLINRVLAVVMAIDLVSLTIMLGLTGGPNNPFTFFFFVNLSLAAVVLSVDWAWRLYLVSLLCFAGLLVDFRPLALTSSSLTSIREAGEFQLVHAGLMIAFSTCASVIVYFMARLNQELLESEHMRWEAETAQARYEKLQALGTLAAGTAHELSTPLSTIAVVAREVETEIQRQSIGSEIAEDIGLIRSELERCRQILNRMNADAGSTTGEHLRELTIQSLAEATLADFSERRRIDLEMGTSAAAGTLLLPKTVLAQAIRGLLSNAVEATLDPKLLVKLTFEVSDENLEITVEDQGFGMTPDVAKRVGEPFFTTKQPGKGMGLGLFLARSVAEQLGGQLELESVRHQGTQVRLRIPRGIPRTQQPPNRLE